MNWSTSTKSKTRKTTSSGRESKRQTISVSTQLLVMNVTFLNKQGRVTVECREGETLLQAGLRQGVPLPYACGAGVCSTCVARAKPGTVNNNWLQAPGGQNLNTAKGECLLCQCEPVADCEILVPGKAVLNENSGESPQHQCGQLGNLVEVAPGVATFELALDQPINFLAGQYLLLRLPAMEGYRPYSMTSFSAHAQKPTFVIKCLPTGSFSKVLFNGSFKTVRVDVFGPMGKAIFDPNEGRDLACMVGGSGIAGIMSILHQARAIGYFFDHKLTMVFGVRQPKDFFFLDALKEIQESAPANIDIHLAVSELSDANQMPVELSGLPVWSGFVHEVAERVMGQDLLGRLGFLGGPPAMLTGALRLLLSAGVPVDDIRYDKFG